MPALSNYPGGFANGVMIRGVPLTQTHPGKVFFVGNGSALNATAKAGSDGNRGSFNDPFATIGYAVGSCVANRGDVIFVLPGHAENVAAAGGITLDVAGVALVGLGYGGMRPSISFITATSAAIKVAANNVSIQNFVFKAELLNVASAFTIANAQVANDFSIQNCEFRDKSAILTFTACVTVGTTANIADGLTFSGNKVLGIASSPAAATTAIVLASDTKRMRVTDNYVCHDVALNDTAALIAGGALNHTSVDISRNAIFRPSTSSTGGLLMSTSSTACSGVMSYNLVGHLDASAAIIIATGSKLSFFENYAMVTGAADKSALINPVAV